MSEIFREVDEDYRQEQLLRFWTENARVIILALIGAIVVAAGFGFWQSHRLHVKESETLALANAVSDAQSQVPAEARAELEKTIQKTSGHRRIAAEFAAARAALAADDSAAAITLYDTIANDHSANRAEHGLAEISSIGLQIDGGDPATLSRRLDPLAKDDSAWRFTAREWQVLLAMRQKNYPAAHDLLAALSQEPKAPPGVQSDAAKLLALPELSGIQTTDKAEPLVGKTP